MSNKEFTKIVHKIISKTLRSHGFLKKGNNFHKRIGDVTQIINLQKNRYSNSETIIITVNLGIYLWPLEYLHCTKVNNPEVSISHWQKRIGHMLPEGGDKWWNISSEEEATRIGNEIANDIEQYCLPEMDKWDSIEHFIIYWENGKRSWLNNKLQQKYMDALKGIQEKQKLQPNNGTQPTAQGAR